MIVNGIKLKVHPIPLRKLVTVWKTLSEKPFPNVKAFKLNDNDFNFVLEHRHCIEDDFREILEWGRILSTKGTDACVFNADENETEDFVILIREKPYHRLEEILIHELSHIARGDL
jgi:hypothetical protein